jgi:hypothetical protein
MLRRALVFALVVSSSVNAFAQAPKTPPEIPYDANPDFLKPPLDMQFGEVAGVAVNSKGNVFVFSRGSTTGPAYGASAAQLLQFGPDGKFQREIGKNLYAWSFAHAVKIDRQDNIWVVDKGSDMIVRFNPEGRVTMVFGRKKEASDEGTAPWTHPNPPRAAVDGQFRQPTDVAWDSKGDLFISDGYVNSRVAKYDKNGDWVMQWGDRNNRRIQVFDTDGKFQRTITIDVPAPPTAKVWFGVPFNANTPLAQQPGSPWAICITPGPGPQYLFVSDAYPGRIYKLSLDGQVLGMLGSTGRQPKQFGWIHEIACPTDHDLYVAELLNWRVQKLTLH